MAQPLVVQVRVVPRPSAWRRFWHGYWRGVRLAVFLAVLGVILLGGVHKGESSPVAAERAIQAQHRIEALNASYEEEQRQADYAAPGAPAPTAGWTP